MKIGEVIGGLTLSRSHPSLSGARYVFAVPQSLANLRGDHAKRAEALVVYDDLGASPGCQIAYSEGGEAAMPFFPEEKPVDAYNAAILDHVLIHHDSAGKKSK